MQPIYLDYNATTPVDEKVLETMLPYFTQKFGNAASTTHSYGWLAKQAVETAQQQVATVLGVEAQQIVFTSGSTEGINLAIKGVWELYSPRKGKHIVTCKTEHKAVLDVCNYLEKFHDATITYLSVNEEGLIDLDELKQVLTDETILVSIMHSNNETGVIQPIKAISEIVHENNSILMSDCTQSIGKISCNLNELGIDIACISAHKFYGPKGIGALYYGRKKPRVALQEQIHGGGHQRGIRSGTLNVPGIVGLGKAIEITQNDLIQFQKKISVLRDTFEQELNKNLDIKINGNQAGRLPNTSNISFKTLPADKLIQLTNGVMAVSTGSACTSANHEPSHVLQAMGLSEAESYSSIRFSLGKYTTKEEIEQVLSILINRINSLN